MENKKIHHDLDPMLNPDQQNHLPPPARLPITTHNAKFRGRACPQLFSLPISAKRNGEGRGGARSDKRKQAAL